MLPVGFLQNGRQAEFVPWRRFPHHYGIKRLGPEPAVIVRFWIISLILVLVGLATLKLR